MEATKCWVCCQLGAREHYSMPRALQRSGSLGLLVTDLWSGRRMPWALVRAASFSGRYHPELEHASILEMNWRGLAFEASVRFQSNGWGRIQSRNRWFQRQAVRAITARKWFEVDSPRTLFSYSYAGREILMLAKDRGWATVLGQIDPGPIEEEIVADLHRRMPDYKSAWEPAPSQYWDEWRAECELADFILVNSLWAHKALRAAGISQEKLRLAPLAYEPLISGEIQRTYPTSFSSARPLRLLFLGQVNLRKGISVIFDALPFLAGQPIEIRIVGPLQVSIPRSVSSRAWVQIEGPAARIDVARHYQWADAFLFPTFSDGFGLTQLEAQGWKLPIISSRFCGEVVRDQENGYLLDDLTGESLAAAVFRFLDKPEILAAMSNASRVSDGFTIPALAQNLALLDSQ